MLRTVSVAVVGLSLAAIVSARDIEDPLFDRFNSKLEASAIGMKTAIRLGSETLGKGTTLNFEDDLGDIAGGRWIGRLAVEYITERRWGFGIAANASAINVDWGGIENPDGDNELTTAIDMDINDISLYVRTASGRETTKNTRSPRGDRVSVPLIRRS